MNIQLYDDVSLQEATEVILAAGDEVTFLMQGEPGIGKSAMLGTMQKRKPDAKAFYVDLTTKDTGDIAMPMIKNVEGEDICAFVPNIELGLHTKDQPVILMWDELGKASRPVMNACLRLLHEGKLGEFELPKGSIQFATTNLSSDQLGDLIPPHVGNRMGRMTVRKPTADEWLSNYALPNGLHPTVIQTVSKFPQMLQSYREVEKPGDNNYIYDPRAVRDVFASPRSFEKAAKTLTAVEGLNLSTNAITHVMRGIVGDATAMDMMSIHTLYSQLPDWSEITENPQGTRIPESIGAQCLLMYTCMQRIDKDSVFPFLKYLRRLPQETQALFASAIQRTPKVRVVAANSEFLKWVTENNYRFVNNG